LEEPDVEDEPNKKQLKILGAKKRTHVQNIMQWHLEKDNAVHLESLLRLIVMHSDCNLSNLVSTIPGF